jgi:hypothetical protein
MQLNVVDSRGTAGWVCEVEHAQLALVMAPQLRLRHAHVYIGRLGPSLGACAQRYAMCGSIVQQCMQLRMKRPASGVAHSSSEHHHRWTKFSLPSLPILRLGPCGPDVIGAGPGRLRLHSLLPQARSKMVGGAGGQAAWHSTSANLHTVMCGYYVRPWILGEGVVRWGCVVCVSQDR